MGRVETLGTMEPNIGLATWRGEARRRRTEEAGTKYCGIQSQFCRAVGQLPPNQGEKDVTHTHPHQHKYVLPRSRPSCITAALPRDGSGGRIVKLVLQSAAGPGLCMLQCSVMRQLHAKMQISPSATLKPSSASSPSTIQGEEKVWRCAATAHYLRDDVSLLDTSLIIYYAHFPLPDVSISAPLSALSRRPAPVRDADNLKAIKVSSGGSGSLRGRGITAQLWRNFTNISAGMIT